MATGLSYFKLLDALREPECPVCRLLLEDSRVYLDHLLYESVLDVPTRMTLMESFGLCSWHARQVPSLPSICAPAIGFAIFAADWLRKFSYAGRVVAQHLREKRTWKSWLGKRSRRILPLMKERSCPACDHVKQFESYRLKDLLDGLGETEFLETYKVSQGICLPHLFLLEQTCPSHENFPLLLELQLAKVDVLRETVEEFIRKQDYRFADQLTPAETAAWKCALAMLTGEPGVFPNETGHDLSQWARERATSRLVDSFRNSALASSYSVKEMIGELSRSQQVTVYLKKPLPADLFDALREVAAQTRARTIEAAVEGLEDVGYLRRLHRAKFSLYYGIALPAQTILLLDQNRGFLLEEGQSSPAPTARALKNPEDARLELLWHRFGIAVSFSGAVKESNRTKGLFCVVAHGKRDQWCRWKNPAGKLPEVGDQVEVFGWEKWNTGIIEVLDLRAAEPATGIAR